MALIKLFERGVMVGDVLAIAGDTKYWLTPAEIVANGLKAPGTSTTVIPVGVCFNRSRDENGHEIAKVINIVSGGTMAYKTTSDTDGAQYISTICKKKNGHNAGYRSFPNVARAVYYGRYGSGGTNSFRVPTADEPVVNTQANVFPVQYDSFYNSTYCEGIRKYYTDYESYIRQEYMTKYPQSTGVFALPDGKTITYALKDSAHPAFQYCASVSYEADGLRAGSWWLPGVKEGVELLDDATLSIVRASFSLLETKEVTVNPPTNSSHRWFAQRYSASNAWIFSGARGSLNYYSVGYRHLVQAVTLLGV